MADAEITVRIDVDGMEEVKAAIAALVADNERLRAALRPFADAAEVYDLPLAESPGHHVWAGRIDGPMVGYRAITVQNLRNARAALGEVAP